MAIRSDDDYLGPGDDRSMPIARARSWTDAIVANGCMGQVVDRSAPGCRGDVPTGQRGEVLGDGSADDAVRADD
jgi:hypothetical protein